VYSESVTDTIIQNAKDTLTVIAITEICIHSGLNTQIHHP